MTPSSSICRLARLTLSRPVSHFDPLGQFPCRILKPASRRIECHDLIILIQLDAYKPEFDDHVMLRIETAGFDVEQHELLLGSIACQFGT